MFKISTVVVKIQARLEPIKVKPLLQQFSQLFNRKPIAPPAENKELNEQQIIQAILHYVTLLLLLQLPGQELVQPKQVEAVRQSHVQDRPILDGTKSNKHCQTGLGNKVPRCPNY